MIDLNLNPDKSELRRFAMIGVVAFGGFGAWVYFKHTLAVFKFEPSTAQTVAIVLWCLAGWCALSALLLPMLAKPIYVLLTLIGFPIGLVVSHLLFGFVYYALVTPIGLLFRLMGRDALTLKLDREASSYWVERRPPKDIKRYFRQF